MKINIKTLFLSMILSIIGITASYAQFDNLYSDPVKSKKIIVTGGDEQITDKRQYAGNGVSYSDRVMRFRRNPNMFYGRTSVSPYYFNDFNSPNRVYVGNPYGYYGSNRVIVHVGSPRNNYGWDNWGRYSNGWSTWGNSWGSPWDDRCAPGYGWNSWGSGYNGTYWGDYRRPTVIYPGGRYNGVNRTSTNSRSRKVQEYIDKNGRTSRSRYGRSARRSSGSDSSGYRRSSSSSSSGYKSSGSSRNSSSRSTIKSSSSKSSGSRFGRSVRRSSSTKSSTSSKKGLR